MERFAKAVLVFLGIVSLYRYVSRYGRKSRMPGPKSYPFVGAALQLKSGRFHEQFFEFARQYGNMFEIQLLSTTTIVLNKADLIKKAFCADGYKQIFNDRPPYFITQFIYEGKGLITRNQDKVQSDLRKVLIKGINFFGDGIADIEIIVKNEIHRIIKVIEDSEEGDFEVYENINSSLCNIISIMLIGENATETDVDNFIDIVDGQNYFASAVPNTILSNLPFLLYVPFYKTQFDKIMVAKQRVLEKYFYRVKESRIPGKIRGIVDWYLSEQQIETTQGREPFLTDGAIKAAILEFISAGIITTASALPSAILCLANHPEYQTKIQEELDHVIPEDREPLIQDKHKCDFMNAVIMETLRLQVPGPFSLPHNCSEDTEFEGYKITADTQVLVNNWFIHHDEEVWGDPWNFRPGRFLDEHGNPLPNTHPTMNSWIPFGVGRRKCPGMSLATSRIFLFLSYFLRKWTFLPSPGKCGSCDPRTGSFECDLLINKPKPFYCIAKRRELI